MSTLTPAVLVQLLNFVGSAGSCAAGIYSLLDAELRLRRIEEMLRELQSKCAATWITDFADTPDGKHLLEVLLQKVEREHSANKRQRFANVIFMSWISNKPPQEIFDEGVLFARATSQFTEVHIAILHRLNEAGETGSISFSELSETVGVDSNSERDRDEATMIVLADLCSRFAFVRRAWDLNKPQKKEGLLKTSNLGPETLAKNCYHAITSRGSRYVRHVVRGEHLQLR